MKQTYKVLITTSGLGSRLGDKTKYTNKALIALGDKPVLSHIIDIYPQNTEFVITLGYFGDHVKNFLKLAYPKRKFRFVTINNYQGKGSSLVYSMLQTEKYLQAPFIFHASDTILTETPQLPEHNWIGGFKGKDFSQYRSFNVIDNKVQLIKEKGELSTHFLHIGLVGIKNYNSFWKSIQTVYKNNKNDSSLSDAHVINDMILHGETFTVNQISNWYDTGNLSELLKAEKNFNKTFFTLEKLEESIFFLDDMVIKFFFDSSIAKNRFERSKYLKGLVPKVISISDTFYSYKKVPGELYSKVANSTNFKQFLEWTKKHLWKKQNEVSQKKFKEVCLDFYKDKSLKRINSYLTKNNLKDQSNVINGVKVPTIKKIFNSIDFNWLCNAKQYMFHGDFILDNIIKNGDTFYLLDWRQNFGGLLKSGDLYYDLAKLNHNLIVNHSVVNSNLFTIEINQEKITCDIYRKHNLVECQELLFDFMKENGYDAKKVKILTGIIWLNMSALHHNPFDLFLFHFGKLYLWNAIQNYENS